MVRFCRHRGPGLLAMGCLVWIVGAGAVPDALAGERPNIVVILCDDLGYGDVRAFNPAGKIATPRLDRLAAEGAIFTDAHSGSAVCSPTRYGLITGRYSWRSRLQQGVLGGLSPRLIEPGRLSVAEMLRQRGYRTTCIGKWHLGMDWTVLPGKGVNELGIEAPDQVHNVDYSRPIVNGPNTVGFDEYFGISASLDMVPYTFLRNDRVAAPPTVDKDFAMMAGRPGGRTRLGPGAPQFEAIDVMPALTREAVAYIDARGAAARQGLPFFLYLPFASPHTPTYPAVEWQGKSGINPYADFVMQTDDAIGQVLDALEKNGVAENTLVLVASDNGCSPEAKFDELAAHGHNPNHAFRGHKADIYEGGHRIPLLARWPGHAPAGGASDRLVCLVDLMATVADILDVPLPPDAAEDSVSFLPALLGDAKSPPRPAVVHHSANGSFAIREGDWKLALCPGSGGWSVPRPGRDDTSKLPLVQLFNLRSDPGEQVNVQAEHAETVARLAKLLDEYVSRGRSTPGPAQRNTVAVDVWKAGKAAHRPTAPQGAGAR